MRLDKNQLVLQCLFLLTQVMSAHVFIDSVMHK
jgi:hypothetical protein